MFSPVMAGPSRREGALKRDKGGQVKVLGQLGGRLDAGMRTVIAVSQELSRRKPALTLKQKHHQKIVIIGLGPRRGGGKGGGRNRLLPMI
jgi:hypothetical protein